MRRPAPGTNISLIPYVSVGVSKDHQGGGDYDFSSEIGGDIKVAVTSSLNLERTINPDFSQVELVQQVTLTERFQTRIDPTIYGTCASFLGMVAGSLLSRNDRTT
ncbi:MAG: DUF5916 domain-containing protein [Cyclobacteriaceae bacterium]|nr:DUF5916 domain-containing protein [Cyclobacteriaceae bacterium]